MAKYRFNDNDTPASTNPDAKPELTRKGEGRMGKADLQRVMRGLITDAQSLAVDELADARLKATEYYNGEPLGNEEEGRSQVVITEVRDQVLGIKPSLMRIFFAPESAVEFMPRTEDGVQGAKQATDYVNYVFSCENPGFRLTNDVLDDGLIRRLGIFKWGWEDKEVIADSEEDLTLDELFELVAREEVTPTKITDNGETGEDARFNVEFTVEQEGCVRIYALPPEEFIFDREATDIENATMVGHARHMTAGELIAMGVKPDDIAEHGGMQATLESSSDKQQRNENTTPNVGQNPDAGEANDLHLYCETYTKVDVDGDGRRELRKICTIGPSFYIVHNRPVSHRPFSMFCPIPEAHALVGLGLSDLAMDLQYVKSNLTRGMLDSFALSIFPRTAFIEGQASVEDVLNTEIGAPIRMKMPGAVEAFTHPFTGQAAMPLLEYFDQVGENRTGRNKGAMSLDADALQSSTAGAVQAALTAAQERTEFIARIFAEQALKPMFHGIYRLLVEYKPKDTLMKLRGEYVPINVAAWDSDYTCNVTVALGTSLPEQRIERLLTIAAKQEQVIQLAGPDNPLVSLAQLRHTYARILELSGERDISSYFKTVDPNYAPPQMPPPPPTPEQVLAEAQVKIEQMKVMKDIALKESELDLKRQEQEFRQNFEIAKLAQESTLKRYAIDSQFDAQHSQMMEELDAAADEQAIRAIIDGRRQAHAERVAQRQDEVQRAKMAQDEQENQLDRQHEADQQTEQHLHEQDLAASAAPAQGSE